MKDIATTEELKIKINEKTKEKEEAEAKRIADPMIKLRKQRRNSGEPAA